MVCERHLAAWAFEDIAAIAAEDIRGAAAPVEEQDRLLPVLERLSQRCLQTPG